MLRGRAMTSRYAVSHVYGFSYRNLAMKLENVSPTLGLLDAILSAGLPMWGAWCKTLVGGFSLGEWEPLCPRPTLPEAACNTAGGLGGAVSQSEI